MFCLHFASNDGVWDFFGNNANFHKLTFIRFYIKSYKTRGCHLIVIIETIYNIYNRLNTEHMKKLTTINDIFYTTHLLLQSCIECFNFIIIKNGEIPFILICSTINYLLLIITFKLHRKASAENSSK